MPPGRAMATSLHPRSDLLPDGPRLFFAVQHWTRDRQPSTLETTTGEPRGSPGPVLLARLNSVAQVVAGVSARVLLQVILVVLLGRVELARRHDLGRHGARPFAGPVHFAPGRARRPAAARRSPRRSRSGTACRCRSPGGSSSSGRAVGRSTGGSLRTRSSRGRTRSASTPRGRSARSSRPRTGGFFRSAAGVAHRRIDDARDLPDELFDAPEAAAREDRRSRVDPFTFAFSFSKRERYWP